MTLLETAQYPWFLSISQTPVQDCPSLQKVPKLFQSQENEPTVILAGSLL
jgi:hypothetical protein